MWVFVHMCSGLAVGALLGGRASSPRFSLVLLLALSLVAHALLDLVPHWDYTRTRHRAICAVLDVAGAAVLAAAFWTTGVAPGWLVIVGAVSALPDLDVLDAVLPIHTKGRVFPSHWRRFPHGRCRAGWGIPIQACVVALSMAALLA